MKKPAIPTVQAMPSAIRRLFETLKENVEVITGRRGEPVAQLNEVARPIASIPLGAVNSGTPAGDHAASAAEVAELKAKVNELLTRLQE